MLTEIFVVIPIVVMVVSLVVISNFVDFMPATLISLGIAAVVTFGLGQLGKKIGLWRVDKKEDKV